MYLIAFSQMRLPLFISVLMLAAGLFASAQSFVPVPHQVQYHEGKGLKVAGWMRLYMTYVVPLLIGFIFVFGLYNFFKA